MSKPKVTVKVKPSKLCTALAAALVLSSTTAFAQDPPETEDSARTSTRSATTLDKVTVTGSLIPQSTLETANPVSVITADDIHGRGYTTIAEVLQQSSFASGGIQGGETSASFTQGAETVSMFGLSPSYTKYLIDGRPMANYPALYNGSDTFNSISGIPIDMVDRVEILPGGSSSLYGSDALAGVVNIILKKNIDGSIFRVRGGSYTDGGGSSLRASFSQGFSAADDRLNGVFGLQYDTRDPIWGFQRDVTDSVNDSGYTAAVASRDYLVFGYRNLGTAGLTDFGYVLPVEAENCANIRTQFGGGVDYRNRPGSGEYCGSFNSPGYRTISNGKETAQGYGYINFDINDNLSAYASLLYSHDTTEYATGSNYTWWGTGTKYGYYYDPDFDAFLNLQRVFTPEDIGGGGYRDIMNKITNESYQFSAGLRGGFGESWDFDVSVARNASDYTDRSFVRFADPINTYFEDTVLGPSLGADPYFGAYPVFRPDYAAFYSTNLTPEEFASFTGYATSKARTWDNVARAQLTNGSLFSLPGGDAGFAVALEAGNEGWDYAPYPGLLNGDIWGQTDVTGAAHRTRYAAMTEVRLPVFNMLTATVSGRYDAFETYGVKVDKPTWSAGLEFRPVESLLLRGRYGTAFKSPTLSDTHQGLSGYYTFDTDYYRCALPENGGYLPGDTDDCAYSSVQYFGTQAGNTELEPINADYWSAGFVFAPIANLSFTADYYYWDIRDEVQQLSGDDILLQEYYCRNNLPGGPGATSCDNVADWIERGAGGNLVSIFTPKVNVAQQKLEVLAASARYWHDTERFGKFNYSASYTKSLKHTAQTLPSARVVDLIDEPAANWAYDAGPEFKADAALGWASPTDKWGVTVYANMIGPSWNYLAAVNDNPNYVHGPSGERAGKWGSYTTFNVGFDYSPLDSLTLSLRVRNAFNKTPDFQASNYPGTSTVPYNNFLYSAAGRSFLLEMTYNFGAND